MELRDGVVAGARMSQIAQHYAAKTHKKSLTEQNGRQTVSIHVRQEWDYGAKGFVGHTKHSTEIKPHLGVQYYGNYPD